MRLEQLSYLLEIQKHHSMNIAGNTIHISQQAISIALRKLEDELNVKLINGTAKGTYLTHEGELVAQAAADIFARLDILNEQLQKAHEQPSPQPSITFLLHAGMLRRPELLPHIHAAFKNYKISAITCQLHDMIPMLTKLPNHIGLTYLFKEDREELTQAGLTCINLEKYTFGAYVSHHSPFAQLPSVSIYELIDAYPIMCFHEYQSENNTVKNIISRFHLEHSVQWRAVTSAFFHQLILNDSAAGLLFDNEWQVIIRAMDNADGVFIPLKEKLSIYSDYIISKKMLSPTILDEVSIFFTQYYLEK